MSDTQANIDRKQQRARVLRTAWTIAAIAVAIYVAFILRGVLGK